jgi:hypothetical protein
MKQDHLTFSQMIPNVPWMFGSSFGVLESSRDVWGSSGCFWEVPGVFGKFRMFLGSFRDVFAGAPPPAILIGGLMMMMNSLILD